jgi:rod shape-determining protein MreD
MPILYYFIGWVLVTFCQIVIVPRLAVLGIYPDVLVAVIIMMGLKRGWRAGLWFGFVFGLSVDLLDPQKLGWMTLLLSLTGYLVGVIRETIYMENPWFEVAVVSIFTFLYQIAYRFLPGPSFFLNNLLMSLADSIFIAIYTSAVAAMGLWLWRQRLRLFGLA